MKYFLAVLAAILIMGSCVEIIKPFDMLPPGIWHAELKIDNEHVIPFNFEIGYNEDESLTMHLINGPERIEVKDVQFGKNKKLLDTVYIDFPLMDSHIKAIYKENIIEGFWTVRNREDYSMPFVAFFGQDHRFTTNAIPPSMDVSGLWQATFEIETEDEYPAVGEFTTDGNDVEGTFMTETGDYRYLQGEVQGDRLMLSCFDGSHAFLFDAKIREDETLFGKFFSGNHYETNWVAKKDPNATLANPYELSAPVDPDKELTFSLKNTDGAQVSLSDDQFAGKAKLIMLMGTWCPNCLDESKFLIDYLKKNPNNQLSVLAVAFERYRDETKALEAIANYKNRLNIPYEMVYGGYFDKAEATANFQYLDEIISYPTLLFVDKENKVTKVHTGFAGPATSKYKDFVVEFEKEIKALTL